MALAHRIRGPRFRRLGPDRRVPGDYPHRYTVRRPAMRHQASPKWGPPGGWVATGWRAPRAARRTAVRPRAAAEHTPARRARAAFPPAGAAHSPTTRAERAKLEPPKSGPGERPATLSLSSKRQRHHPHAPPAQTRCTGTARYPIGTAQRRLAAAVETQQLLCPRTAVHLVCLGSWSEATRSASWPRVGEPWPAVRAVRCGRERGRSDCRDRPRLGVGQTQPVSL